MRKSESETDPCRSARCMRNDVYCLRRQQTGDHCGGDHRGGGDDCGSQ